jgi:hypothetical protein
MGDAPTIATEGPPARDERPLAAGAGTGAGAGPRAGRRFLGAALGGALAVLALQGLAIARQSLTSDEAYHILAGYQADRWGRNSLNLEHPPLVKMVAALPLLSAPGEPLASPQLRVSTALAAMQVIFTRPEAEARARLGGRLLLAGLFGLPLLGAAFLLGRELGGDAAGLVLALVLGLDFSVFPLLPLLYADAAAALGFLLTLLAAARFLRRPDLGSAALVGLGLGLAAASKLTGLLALPAVAGALLAAPGLRPGWPGWRRRLLGGALALTVAWGVVELTYAVANRRYAPAFGRETIELYCADRSTILVGDRLRPAAGWLLAVERFDPRAAQWLTGLLATRAQNSIGVYPACNFGTMSSRGRWWYFPVLLLAKTPLPLLAASAGALAAALAVARRRGRRQRGEPVAEGEGGSPDAPGGTDMAAVCRRRFVWLLAATAGAYLAVAMGSNYNAGLRHLLPVLPVLYLPAALWASRRPRVAAALLAALLVESLALAPVWISSANTWWLGARDPLRFALSTDNCYYHQNLIALHDEAERRALRPLLVLDPALGTSQVERYLGAGASAGPEGPLAPGWYAVGAGAEVCLPAILRSSPAEMYGFSRYRAIAERWLPAVAAVSRAGDDLGYAAGTFHLYRLATGLPAARPAAPRPGARKAG